MAAAGRVRHAAAGLLGGEDDVDQALGRPPPGDLQRGVLAIGAGRQQHGLGAALAAPENAQELGLDRARLVGQRLAEAAGDGGAQQRLAQRLDLGIGRRGDRGRGRGGERQHLGLWPGGAAIGVERAGGVEVQTAAAAQGQQMLARRGQRRQRRLATARQRRRRAPGPAGPADSGRRPRGHDRARRRRAAATAPARAHGAASGRPRRGSARPAGCRVIRRPASARNGTSSVGIDGEEHARAQRAQLRPAAGQREREAQLVGRAGRDPRRPAAGGSAGPGRLRARCAGARGRSSGARSRGGVPTRRRSPQAITASSSRSRSASVVRWLVRLTRIAEPARQARGRGRGDAALLQVGDDLGVEAVERRPVEPRRTQAEADDVERDRRHQLQALAPRARGSRGGRPGGSCRRSPAPSLRVPCSFSVNQTFSARKPRDSSGPNSQGQGAPPASPRAARSR